MIIFLVIIIVWLGFRPDIILPKDIEINQLHILVPKKTDQVLLTSDDIFFYGVHLKSLFGDTSLKPTIISFISFKNKTSVQLNVNIGNFSDSLYMNSKSSILFKKNDYCSIYQTKNYEFDIYHINIKKPNKYIVELIGDRNESAFVINSLCKI